MIRSTEDRRCRDCGERVWVTAPISTHKRLDRTGYCCQSCCETRIAQTRGNRTVTVNGQVTRY